MLAIGLAALFVGAAAPPVVHPVPGTPLRIALPASWRTIDRATAEELVKRLATLNPQTRAFAEAVARQGSLIRLLAYDPHSTHGFATNANVVAERAPNASLARIVAAELQGLRQVTTPVGLRETSIRAAGRPAMRVTYEALFNEPSGATLVAQRQIYIVSSGTVYVITLTTLPSQRGTYAHAFTQIVAGLRFG